IGLRSGQVIRLSCEDGAGEALYALLCEARRAAQRRAASPTEEALARAGRSPNEWVRDLRALADGATATHRTAPLREDALWEIVEDPAASLEARAAAAVALVSIGGGDARARLRVAATTANARLRVALETVAGATTDDELEHALAGVGDEDVEAPRAMRF